MIHDQYKYIIADGNIIFSAKTAGVFHLRSPAGKYMMNYSAAEMACKSEDATLATLSQLSDAQQVNTFTSLIDSIKFTTAPHYENYFIQPLSLLKMP